MKPRPGTAAAPTVSPMPGSVLFWKYTAFTATGFLVGALVIDHGHQLAGHLIGLVVIGLLIALDYFVGRYRSYQRFFNANRPRELESGK